jgi:eukaryotic-like serine/threonine-protein kinase
VQESSAPGANVPGNGASGSDVRLSEAESSGSMATKMSYFRCACGCDVCLQGLNGICHKCGRAISLAALDASQTLSFLSTGEINDVGPSQQTGVDRSGERLGHFRLVSLLGQGGMGVVYRALDESLQRYVAVKVMRCTGTDGSSTARVTRLLDEAVAQARLNHPHVVTIYYVGRDSTDPFFAMELLPGPTLDKLLLDGPLPYPKVIKHARQVTSALVQATRLNLVHGDIKPSNLIIAAEDTIKLGDFGLAYTDQKASVGISGTLSYMAPELADGHAPTAQSDMYALGITLFELTFGRRPYSLSGQTLPDQLRSHRSAEVEFPEKWPAEIPERWREVLERLLAKEPQDRYASYESLDAYLQAIAPVGVTKAGRLNRALALMVDFFLQAVIMGSLSLPGIIASQVTTVGDSSLAILARSGFGFVSLLALLVPAGMAWIEWSGWKTPGRYLFQLRVVDVHGLRLTRRKRLLRNLVRNVPVWMLAFSIIAMTLNMESLSPWLRYADEVFLLINAIPILGPARRTLHDRFFGSHVVLDTTK